MPALHLLLLLLLSTAGLASPAARSAAGPMLGADDATTVEDPRTLARSADHHRSSGALETAEQLYEASLRQEEIERYIGAAMRRPYVRRALVSERMGRTDEAAAAWREGWTDDVHMTLLLLRMRSIHPDREALVAEGLAHLRASLDRAAQGERVVLYRTSKGADRPLKVITADEALARIRSGDGTFRYTWIRGRLDLGDIPSEDLPEDLFFFRTVLDGLRVPDKDVHSFGMKAIVLGDLELGKTWTGAANNSSAIPASRFDSLNIQESLFLGRTVLQDVKVRDRMAYFVLSAFEGDEPADFRGLEADGMADFRFSVFRHGANYKDAHFTDAVYFGHTRYIRDATFRGMFSEQDVFFNSARFEASATFDHCEWSRGITFEDTHFDGPVSFNNSEAGGRLNLSRTVFGDRLEMKEVRVGGMDLIGAWLKGPARFIDVLFRGKVRFSLDDITRSAHLDDPSGLLSLYRDYQGDKDAMEPLTEQSSYGVQHVDDLIARVDGDLSFANSMFQGFCVFERVRFGLPQRAGLSRAEFYNTQFLGEAHFERTEWYAVADFETIFASELSFNGARFHHSLVLDDANVSQRATLTDARFLGDANLSFYGAEIASFQIEQVQLMREDGEHRLFYRQCAEASGAAPADIRMARLHRGTELAASAVSTICHDRSIDEWVMLKGSFGERAMVDSEDWAYWHARHTELLKAVRHGSLYERVVAAIITWPIFELCFGWGVRLGNLAVTSLLVTLLFAGLYRWLCPDTVVAYRGADVAIRDVPWHGLVYISLQSLGAFNTGWDFGEDDWRFQYLNTLETFIGIIVLTFFVGAYTRMILA